MGYFNKAFTLQTTVQSQQGPLNMPVRTEAIITAPPRFTGCSDEDLCALSSSAVPMERAAMFCVANVLCSKWVLGSNCMAGLKSHLAYWSLHCNATQLAFTFLIPGHYNKAFKLMCFHAFKLMCFHRLWLLPPLHAGYAETCTDAVHTGLTFRRHGSVVADAL